MTIDINMNAIIKFIEQLPVIWVPIWCMIMFSFSWFIVTAWYSLMLKFVLRNCKDDNDSVSDMIYAQICVLWLAASIAFCMFMCGTGRFAIAALFK